MINFRQLNLKVEEVWGQIDGIDATFQRVEGEKDLWSFSLPLDLIDGYYAAFIHARASNDTTCSWSGYLYVSCGVACLHLEPTNFCFQLLPERQINFTALPPRPYDIVFNEHITIQENENNRVEIILKEDCIHGTKLHKKILL